MNTNERKSPFRINRLVEILFFVSAAFLILAVYAFYHPQKPDVVPSGGGETAALSTEPTPEATPLPAHLTDPDSIFVFVDKNHPVPQDFVPSDLVSPYFNSTGEIIQLKAEPAEHLKKMIAAASKDKVQLVVFCGYVSYQTQDEYFQDRAAMLGEAEAGKVIEKPGYSEHQCGIAVDFSSNSTSATTVAYADTDAGKWLYEHAHEYGFILRYPKGKEQITGYSYMPWHYRYIGETYASMMYEISPDLSLEEFYDIKK